MYDGLNYGSYLQAFALQSFLEQLNKDVYFVQRFSEEDNLKLFTTQRPESQCGIARKCWRAVKRFAKRKELLTQQCHYLKIFPYFQDAWKLFNRLKTDQLHDIDYLICGSDEIWNVHNAFIDAEFYACSDYGKEIPKVAVAVSCGNSTIEEMLKSQKLVSAIREFHTILVRDELSQKIIEILCGYTPRIICDPTLLVDKKLFLKSECRLIKGDYMLVYAYNLTKLQCQVLLDYAKVHHLKIISPCNDLQIADEVIYTSPLDFANLVYYAKCCYTSTFHGAIFSLLFGKHVCISPGFPKVRDIAMKLCAENFLWEDDSADDFEDIMNVCLNRDLIDREVEKLRDYSIRLICEALQGCVIC